MGRVTYTAAHWGIYEVESTSDGAPRLLPFARDADPSSIGLDQLDPSLARLRIQRPALRQSVFERGPGASPERRGREPFVEVDWSVALKVTAGELQRVRGAYGNEAIFGGSYGWASAGRFHHAVGQLHRFLNGLGGYVRSVDSYSLGAGRALMPHVVANMDESNASHTSWSVLAEHTATGPFSAARTGGPAPDVSTTQWASSTASSTRSAATCAAWTVIAWARVGR